MIICSDAGLCVHHIVSLCHCVDMAKVVIEILSLPHSAFVLVFNTKRGVVKFQRVAVDVGAAKINVDGKSARGNNARL